MAAKSEIRIVAANVDGYRNLLACERELVEVQIPFMSPEGSESAPIRRTGINVGGIEKG